jgi:streptomycin 6-kinase
MEGFWERCAETKVNMECVMRGDDDWTTTLAINAVRQKVKALPVQASDIGPMPDYGTKDFWAWCHKRKKLKEQKEAAIVAAGGVVKEKKPKVSKATAQSSK